MITAGSFGSIITAESFGSIIPKNWEEIADYMNKAAEERIERIKKNDPDLDDESSIYDEVWEDFWNGEFADPPIVVF